MKRFKLVLAAVLLAISATILISMVFTPQPIQILLETGQEIATQTPEYYSLSQVLILMAASFTIGVTSIYLFYNSDKNLSDADSKSPQKKEGGRMNIRTFNNPEKYELMLPLLKSHEKEIFLALKDSGGEMLQNRLVVETGLSKVKVTRALAKLQSKGILMREKYGITNRVMLK